MYILKNAFVSITRNKGRNFLIGVIVIVIACAATVTLAISSSANNLIESYESQYDVLATIGINRNSMRSNMKMDGEGTFNPEERKNNMSDIFQNVSNISVSEIEDYGDSEYVNDYYYTISIGVSANDVEKVSMDSGNSGDNAFGGAPNGRGKENFGNMDSSDFTLTGYSSISSMEEFINGKYSIVDGELVNDLESSTCVINSELAALNNLNVGDEIVLVDPNNDNNTITLKITGIFEEASDSSEAMGMFTSSANIIITNTNVVESLVENNSEIKKTITPTFILTSKEVIEKFEEELSEKGLSEYLTVTTNLEQVSGATSTISNVKTFATTFLLLTLIIGGIVLFVINMINIRERRYEIGVLRTIGMKKKYLTLQFISELLIVSLVALFVGGIIGSVSSVKVSNYLLQNEISNNNSKTEDINKNFGGKMDMNEFNKFNGVVSVQAFDKIDAVVDLKVLVELFGIGIVLTLISSCASMISIQKFSPLVILKERS